MDRFWSKVQKLPGDDACWEWTGSRARGGYGLFCALGERMAHRVSKALANGPIPDGLWVLHRCDNPPCVRPDHLFLGTALDNVRDMVSKGRGVPPVGDSHWTRSSPGSQAGAGNFNARLAEPDVIAIKVALSSGEEPGALSRRYGVTVSTVSLISNGSNWSHVPWPEGAAFGINCNQALRSRGIRRMLRAAHGDVCAGGCGRPRDGMRTRCAECWAVRRKQSKRANAAEWREKKRAERKAA